MTKREVVSSLPVLTLSNPPRNRTFLDLHGRVTWTFGSLFLLLAVFLQAQSILEPSIQSSNQGGSLLMQISRPTTLRKVTIKFCESTATRCQGTENVPDDAVPVMSIKGTWNEVLNELFAGVALNYVATPPTPSTSGSLLIEKCSRPTQPDASTAAHFPTVQNVDPATFVSGGIGAAIFDSNSRPDNEEGSVSSEANSVSQMAGYLPLLDSHGRPVPAGDKRSGGLPFGDIGTGPESTNGTQFLPFPDSHGKPVPSRPSQTSPPFPTERK